MRGNFFFLEEFALAFQDSMKNVCIQNVSFFNFDQCDSVKQYTNPMIDQTLESVS